jgi:hypothetical protein
MTSLVAQQSGLTSRGVAVLGSHRWRKMIVEVSQRPDSLNGRKRRDGRNIVRDLIYSEDVRRF